MATQDSSNSQEDVFGNLEEADMSNVQVDPQNQINPQDVTKMAKQMAQRMTPQDIACLQDKLKNMVLDIKTIPILVQMRQYAPLKFMLKGKEDPQVPEALGTILDLTKDATKGVQIQLAQLVLSVKPTTLDVSTYHVQAQVLLDSARAQNTKSSKSQRIRAKREKVRRMRMKKKK